MRQPVIQVPSMTHRSALVEASKSSTVFMPRGRPRLGLASYPPEEALMDMKPLPMSMPALMSMPPWLWGVCSAIKGGWVTLPLLKER